MATKREEEAPLAQPPVRRQTTREKEQAEARPGLERDNDERNRLLVEKPHDFIERTLPEDRLSLSGGQLTRDNVNPNIPSAPTGAGPIVDPSTLGMEQGGVAGDPVPTENVLDTPHGTGTAASINEPPGSTIGSLNPGGPGGPPAPIEETDPPDLLDIDPDVATIGDGDLTLTCTGENFTPDSVIVFNGGDEPTTFVNDTTVTTIVKPSTASVAGEFPVAVRNAIGESEPLSFEFVEPARAATAKARPKKPKKAPRKKK